MSLHIEPLFARHGIVSKSLFVRIDLTRIRICRARISDCIESGLNVVKWSLQRMDTVTIFGSTRFLSVLKLFGFDKARWTTKD